MREFQTLEPGLERIRLEPGLKPGLEPGSLFRHKIKPLLKLMKNYLQAIRNNDILLTDNKVLHSAVQCAKV